MKLLVLNWLDPLNPQSGGAEVHLREIFGRLVKRGHSVTLLCSAWRGSAPRAEVDGIEVHRIAGRHTLSLAAPAYFQCRLWRRHFDLIVEDLNKVPFFSPFWVNAPVALIVHHLFGRIGVPILPTKCGTASESRRTGANQHRCICKLVPSWHR